VVTRLVPLSVTMRPPRLNSRFGYSSIPVQGSPWIVKSHDGGFRYLSSYLLRALSGNPVISVNAPLRPCVKLKNNNAKTQRRDGAKNKNLWAYFTGIFDCAPLKQDERGGTTTLSARPLTQDYTVCEAAAQPSSQDFCVNLV